MDREIRNLSEVVSYIRREVNAELPIQQLAVLLKVYDTPGITLSEICKQVGMTQGSMTRNLKALSLYMIEDPETGERETRGLNLIDARPDMLERRKTACFITPKGEQVISKILAILKK